MSKRARPALIGLFVVAALGLLVGALVYLGVGSYSGQKLQLELYFRGSVSGLQVGAPVVLKGVQVGSVTGIRVAYLLDAGEVLVPVQVQLEEDAVDWPGEQERRDWPRLHDLLVERGLRARLALQSFVTGRLMVELGFFPGTEARYQLPPEQRGRELPTVASGLEQLKQTVEALPLEDIGSSLLAVTRRLEQLLGSPEALALAGELGAAAASVHSLAQELDRQLPTLAADTTRTLEQLRTLGIGLQQELGTTAAEIRSAAAALGSLARSLEGEAQPLARDLRGAVDAAAGAFAAARRTLDTLQASLDERSPLRLELQETLESVSAAARSLRNMADYLERHPEALLAGKRR